MARKSKEESKKYAEYYQKNFPSWTVEQCENAVKNLKVCYHRVYYVWEMDYRKDPSSELIKCIKFLQS